MPDVRMPDGTIVRNVPANATRDQIMAAYERARINGAVADNRPTSFWRGFRDSLRTATRNMNTVNPVSRALDALGVPGSDKEYNQLYLNQRAKGKYQGSTAGKVTGGIVATIPAALVTKNPYVGGGLSGAMLSEADDATGLALDIAMGAAGGKIGDVVGNRVVAPVAKRTIAPVVRKVVQSAPVQSALQSAPRYAQDAVTKATQGIFGTGLTRSEKTVAKALPSKQIPRIRGNLADAERLRVPYALADASPNLRTLAGSVSRRSLDARQIADDTFAPRSAEQAERAIAAVRRDLAPTVDLKLRASEIQDQANAVANPLYEKALAETPELTPRLQQFLDDPLSHRGIADGTDLQRMEALAQGRPFNPSVTVADEAGNAVEMPNMRSLDAYKKGLDQMIDAETDAVTGRMTQRRPALVQVKNSLVEELDNANPAYGEARAAYGNIMQQRDALTAGAKATTRGVTPEQVADEIAGMSPAQLENYRIGFASQHADNAVAGTYQVNPWTNMAASIGRREKLQAVFPEGSGDFLRQAELERDMARTAMETLGGSPTAARLAADQMLEPSLGPIGVGSITSPKTALARIGLSKMDDWMRAGSAENATKIAPSLFNTDPATARAMLDELIRKQAGYAAYGGLWSRISGPAALTAFPGLLPE